MNELQRTIVRISRERDAAIAQIEELEAQPKYLKEIYAYLASICPQGIADEAFRIVPDSIFQYSERSKILPQDHGKGDSTGKPAGFAT